MARRRGAPAPWTKSELAALGRLSDPGRIQAFLDRIPYSADPIYRSPRRVLRDRKAHCFDGAMFAAAALRRLGHPPLVLDMRAVNDDDHVIAVFRRDGMLGAVAKSNFVGLRFREPIFRTVRELTLSYFEDFFNLAGEKTLRSWSAPVDLSRFDALSWETSDVGLEAVAAALESARHFPLLTARQAARLLPVEKRFFDAGLQGANWKGLYKPKP